MDDDDDDDEEVSNTLNTNTMAVHREPMKLDSYYNYKIYFCILYGRQFHIVISFEQLFTFSYSLFLN